MILIISQPNDIHMLKVLEIFQKSGQPFKLVAPRFDSHSDIHIDYDKNDTNCYLNDIDIKNVISIWYRKPSFISKKYKDKSDLDNVLINEYSNIESYSLFQSISIIYPNIFWLNSPFINVACKKPVQLYFANLVGLNIPKTVIGHNPSNLFASSETKDFIYKPLNNSQIITEKSVLQLMTEKFDKSETQKILETSRDCPKIYQEYTEKAFELRITVVGNHFFSVKMETQADNVDEKTKIDWRKSYTKVKIKESIYDLPTDIKQKILLLMEKLKLKFGCVDMIVKPNGEHIFLEINQNGQWLGYELDHGLQISQSIADILMNPENTKVKN